MAAFLGIKPSHLGWAVNEGAIHHDAQGLYPCETVTAQQVQTTRPEDKPRSPWGAINKPVEW
jgi:hypothetical protein